MTNNLIANHIIIDCQSTGASPAYGKILEIGWASGSWVIKQDQPISNKISKLTGISPDCVENGISRKDAWQLLKQEISSIKAKWAVSHFASFEKRFLDDLWQEFENEPFPLKFLCTHRLTKLLHANLPSYSLRSLAGWVGEPVGELKRCESHVKVTQLVWKRLIEDLYKINILSMDDAASFCSKKLAKNSLPKAFLISKDQRLALPKAPGIYRFLDCQQNTLYIGKATSLKSRVNSYFTGGCKRDHRKLEMLSQARDLKYDVVDTPLEAGLLEYDQIQTHRPAYNIAFKGQMRSPLEDLDILSSYPNSDFLEGHLKLIQNNFAGFTDLEVIERGLHLWRQSNNIGNAKFLSKRHLLNLGLPHLSQWIKVKKEELRLKKIAAETSDKSTSQMPVESLEEDAESEDSTDFVWTEELVADQCSRIVRRAVRRYLQEKWFERLRGSTLAYSLKESIQDRKSKSSLGKNTKDYMKFIAPDLYGKDHFQRTKVLLHELRRLEVNGGIWTVTSPRKMAIPFWV